MKKITSITAILLCTAWMAYGQWTFTNLSAPRDYMGATVLGSKAYFAGGSNDSGLLSSVEIYDTQTGQWTYDNLSVARELPFATTCGSKVIFAGGVDFYISGNVFSTVDIYDTIDQTWTVEQLSVPRLQAAVVSHGNKVLFAGGANLQQGVVYDVVDIYDVETGEWTTASLSEPRVVWWAKVGDLAIFAGGYDLLNSSKRVDIYNFTTETWSIDSLSVPRAFVGMTTIGNKVLIAGGMTTGNVASNIVDVYDASSGNWTTANLSQARAFCDNQNAVTAGGKAYFVGGGKIHLNGAYWTIAYNVIDIFDEADNSWSVDYMPVTPRVHHAVVSTGNKVIIAGGYIMIPPYGCDSTVAIYTCPSSSCLPEGITFETQEQIDNFQTNYSGCTEIEGDVFIEGEINNLNGLNVLTSIGGNLSIGGTNLEYLSGLEALENIGGHCIIGWGGMMGNFGNPYLASLTGLESLTTIVGGLNIAENDLLTNLNGLNSLISVDYLIITRNDLLSSLSGMNNIGANSLSYLAIYGNPSLSSCETACICNYLTNPGGSINIFANAPGCNSPSEAASSCGIALPCLPYGNYIFINQSDIDQFHENFPGCTTLNGNVTIGYDEEWLIPDNNDISNLTGLLGTESITGKIMISTWHDDLITLHGLDSLKTIGGDLYIADNYSLNDISGLESVISVDGGLFVHSSALTTLSGLENIEANSITQIAISWNSSLSECHVQSICDYLANPSAWVMISNNAPGCNSPEEVEEACLIAVGETGAENQITIFPNPADKTISILATGGLEIQEVSISNHLGQVVFRGKPVNSLFDVSGLQPGIYFMIIISGQSKIIRKLIIQ